MSELSLRKTETRTKDGTPVHLVYDQEADVLEVIFRENEPATGVELTEHIILRLNRDTGRAVSLTLLDFAILTERTEYGPRSFPLDRLEEMPEDLRELVLRLVTSMPVSQFLKVSHFQASPTERVPLTYVEPQPVPAVA